MNKRSHPLRPRRPISLGSSRSETTSGSAGSEAAQGQEADRPAELDSDWDSDGDSRFEFGSDSKSDVVASADSDFESDADSESGETRVDDDLPRSLALELPAAVWQWAKLQANMMNEDSVESYCRRLLIEAIESHRAQVRIEGVSSGSGAKKTDRVVDEVQYLSDWTPRSGAALSPQAFADSPMASPNVFSNSDSEADSSQGPRSPSAAPSGPEADIQFEERSASAAIEETIYRDDGDGETEDVNEFEDLLRGAPTEFEYPSSSVLTSRVEADIDVEIQDEGETDSSSDKDRRREADEGSNIMNIKPVPSGPAVRSGRPWTATLSPYREVVLRHAAPGVDDPDALLPTLRRGEPLHPEFAQGLLDALRGLEDRLANSDSIDRKLAFALHRLAFEGQILATDAWRQAPDPTTIDVLRWVQEAVDRVLSGEDIRY